MLVTDKLTYSYNGSTPLTFPDISCPAGEHWLLLGYSGSGKTTLLHLLAGLRTPGTGSVRVGGTDISQLRASKLDKFRGKNIGIVFQEPHFVRALNVEQNLALTQMLSGQKIDKERIHILLERLNLGHKIKAKTNALSQGEKQRVAIARALVNDPVLILADEPTSALDNRHTHEVISLLEEQATTAGATLLVVTHDNRLKEQFPNQITL
jgi:putative ABC transport system ATP-binding protein